MRLQFSKAAISPCRVGLPEWWLSFTPVHIKSPRLEELGGESVWFTTAVPKGANGQAEMARLAELATRIQWARVDGAKASELGFAVSGSWRGTWLKSIEW